MLHLLSFAALLAEAASFPAFETRWFNQTTDHFRFTPEARTTWSHRYLFSDEHWNGTGELANGCKGPILLYTGNEGDIEAFWAANGFMVEHLAPLWNALLVFPEERYFGQSMPFGSDSLLPENAVYLTTEQVLADYAELVAHLKATLPGAANCPVVAFGGSYGGTLTTFMRAKYPHVVCGGLASSAPIGYYDQGHWKAHGVTEFTWSDIATRVYDEAHPDCLSRIHAATAAIEAASKEELVKSMHLCSAASLGERGGQADLFHYALENLPQMNYPYPIGSQPAWPINATCARLTASGDDDEQAVLAAASEFTAASFGWDGETCIGPQGAGVGGVPGDGPGATSWGYQSCTENLHPFSARGLRNFTFSFQRDAAEPCAASWGRGMVPVVDSLARTFGGYMLGDGRTDISNVIWSNGALDPWSGGGFLVPPTDAESSGNHWFLMAKGAHHLDLRGPNDADPTEVTAVREAEEKIIRGWIDDYAAAEMDGEE